MAEDEEGCPLCPIAEEFCEYTGKPDECKELVKGIVEGKLTPEEAKRKLEELISPEKLEEVRKKLLQRLQERAGKAQG